MEQADFADFNARLLGEVPALRAVYEEHVQDNDGVLEIVLMDQYSRFVVEHAAASEAENELFGSFVRVLEKELARGGEDLAVLVGTTFCETVDSYWQQPQFHRWMLARMGPRTRKRLTVR
jgi:hypothetical protein